MEIFVPDETMLRTIRHEAGFYVVGRCLGIEYSGISFEFCSDQNGEFPHWKPTNWILPHRLLDLEQAEKYCKARIIVLLAGRMSEFLTSAPTGSALDYPSARKVIVEAGASDIWRVEELVTFLMKLSNKKVHVCSNDQENYYRAQILEELIYKTGEIVFNNGNSIMDLCGLIISHCQKGKDFEISTLYLKELPFIRSIEKIDL